MDERWQGARLEAPDRHSGLGRTMKHNSEFFEMQLHEMDRDGPFAELVIEADYALEKITSMTPEQRARNLPDIEEAATLLTMALKVAR